jgi:hypothetical protein
VVEATAPTQKRMMSFLFASRVVRIELISLSSRISGTPRVRKGARQQPPRVRPRPDGHHATDLFVWTCCFASAARLECALSPGSGQAVATPVFYRSRTSALLRAAVACSALGVRCTTTAKVSTQVLHHIDRNARACVCNVYATLAVSLTCAQLLALCAHSVAVALHRRLRLVQRRLCGRPEHPERGFLQKGGLAHTPRGGASRLRRVPEKTSTAGGVRTRSASVFVANFASSRSSVPATTAQMCVVSSSACVCDKPLSSSRFT